MGARSGLASREALDTGAAGRPSAPAAVEGDAADGGGPGQQMHARRAPMRVFQVERKLVRWAVARVNNGGPAYRKARRRGSGDCALGAAASPPSRL
jgi:hypothetical protein